MKRPSVEKLVLARIEERGRGNVLTPRDFRDLGSRGAVAVALHRLVKKEVLRNIGNGFYHYPKVDAVHGEYTFSTDDVLKAIERRDGVRIRETHARAANITGISTQVPMRIAYQTDGRSRKIRIKPSSPGGRGYEILLRRTSRRYMQARTEVGYLVIQGLRDWGRRDFGKEEYAELLRRLPPSGKEDLKKDLDIAPVWIADVMRRLIAEAP
jgi:predicted transcriptional regulator of viral defense system